MIIETYLDMTALTKNQSLVLIDDQGQRWSVEEMLNASPKSSLRPSSSSAAAAAAASSTSRVVLERWTIDLGPAPVEQPADLNTLLPVVYKKSIVLFRSLYTYSKFLPAWKFARQNSKPRQLHRALKVNCRIVDRAALDASLSSHVDGLTSPLSTGSSLGRVTDEFSFGATESPAGPFSVTVAYRTNCEFRVDDAEALLSSQLMGVDDGLFRPSLGMQDDRLAGRAVSAKGLGSLPSERREAVELPDRSQAYGSLSSFHQAGPPMASSPLSALRAARDLNPESASSSPPNRALPHVRSAHSSKSSLRSVEGPPPSGVQRRPSVSFMPFKTPSLSASPSQANPLAPLSPRNSLGRTPLVSALTQARNRTSLEVQPSLSGRGPSSIPETSAASSGSASPRPASVSRYSSSFGHRRGRPSSGGVSKPDDENNSSSGRASQTSSQAQPGSGILAEGGGGSGSGGGGGGGGGGGTAGSSGSIPTDDDNISDLLKLLDSKRTLKSFESTGNPAAAADASTKRTNAALSRFQKMRDSHAALSDSLSSSFMLQRSSSTSSRQLSSVPPMVAGTSMSPSSSPGKPNSPHTPHTPAVPSRLSAQSVAVYAGGPDDARECAAAAIDRVERRRRPREVRHEETESARRTGAIDIPRSPRPLRAHNRRSSSVSQRNRALAIEDETGDLLPYGMRSASLGAQERPPLSLSALLGLQDPSDGDGAGSPADESRPASASASARAQRPDLQGEPVSRQSSSSSQPPTAIRAAASARRSSSSHHRPHHHATQRGGRRGSTSPQRGYAGDSGTPDRPAYSFSRPGGYDEDEPLLFAMSEIGGHSSRRSLEDGRAGATAAEGNLGRHAQPSSLSSSPPPSSSTPPPLPPPPPLSSSSSRSSSRPSHQNRSVYQR